MPTKHPIVDNDDIRLEVNLISRAITMVGNSPKKVILIKGDTNSERFTFKIPRHIEGHDVMDTDVRRIHFINTEASTRRQYKGIYDIIDITPFPDDPDNYVIGTWLISNEATQAVGLLAFTLQLGCTEEFESTEGETQIRYQYSWNTSPFTGITIGDGINNAPAIVDEYIDILETWWHRLYASSELPIEVHTLESFAALGGDTEPDTLYLIEDDPAITMLENHDVAIANHETRLTEHDSRITTFESLIKSHDSNISNQTAKLEEVEKRFDNEIDALDNRVDANGNKIATQDATIENLSKNIAALNESCDTLASANEDRISDINYLTSKVKNFYTEPNYTLVGDSVVAISGSYVINQLKAYDVLGALTETKTFSVAFVAGDSANGGDVMSFTSMTFDATNDFIIYGDIVAFRCDSYMVGGDGFAGYVGAGGKGNGAIINFAKGTEVSNEFYDLFLSITDATEQSGQKEIDNGLWLLRVRNYSDTVEMSASLVMDTKYDYSATFPLFINNSTWVTAAVRSTVTDSVDQKVKLDVVKFENGAVETIDAEIYATPFGFNYEKG